MVGEVYNESLPRGTRHETLDIYFSGHNYVSGATSRRDMIGDGRWASVGGEAHVEVICHHQGRTPGSHKSIGGRRE
ncbi:hypothetical protein Pcinc_034477 [Petrolisthes cinctipes]|uniref:Uncharacterized protein n=1 Tax=Petrolisthes cinctipes TaxID=88211 RepID=A0AAE1JVJ5_PETCI|nr:hypothetical protein Pcinc_034477 [Petrolisthes cinctipes]